MPGPYDPYVNSWKDLSAFSGWGEPDDDDKSMAFTAPLDIGGVTLPYFWLRGRCIEDQPDIRESTNDEVVQASRSIDVDLGDWGMRRWRRLARRRADGRIACANRHSYAHANPHAASDQRLQRNACGDVRHGVGYGLSHQ